MAAIHTIYYREGFPAGVAIYFRIVCGPNLAASYVPKGRVVVRNPIEYLIEDADGNLLAIYPVEFVAAILPIETVGPGTK